MKKEEQEALKEVGLQESETSITVNSSQTQLPAYPHNRYIAAATSDNTRKTYQSSIRQVTKWGVKLPCTEDKIIYYITDRAQSVNPRTLSLHLSALRQWHITQGFNDPTSSSVVQKTMAGIRRVHAKPKKKAKALRLEHIAALLRILHAKPESKKKRRHTSRKQLNEIKFNKKCELCSFDDWRALQHHHRGGEEKLFEIGNAVNRGYSMEAIKKEMEKCLSLLELVPIQQKKLFP